MPYTVPASFNKFVENISLTGDHKETATARKDRVVSLLSNSFTILDGFATGSVPRGTALKTVADLDVMVVLHWSKHIKAKSPKQVLQDVRDALAEYRTNVRKNGQAVTLYYDSWPNVDIVPVSRTTNDDGSVNHYNVPNMNSDRWLQSRPRRHSNNIEAKANYCGAYFKPLIRIIKQWNQAHSDLMEPYHIEVLCLKVFNVAISDYSWSVFQFFDGAATLVRSRLAYEDGFADDYLADEDDRAKVLDRIETARDKARTAWYLTYEGRDDHEGAIEVWRQILGDKFPAYG
jgi:SMODS domain-containing protein